MDSSPGLPWVQFAKTNEALQASHSGAVIDSVIDRIILLSTFDFRGVHPLDAILRDAADPTRFFVKNDPHPLAKIDSGRLRLINSVSIVDQMVSKFCFKYQNQREIDSWNTIPSKAGFGVTAEFDNSLVAAMPSGKLTTTDVSGWDFSVTDTEIFLEHEIRIQLIYDCPSPLKLLIRNIAWLTANKVCAFSDMTYVSILGGVMPSGCFNTASSNSRIRYFLSVLAGSTWAMTMGDDCVEKTELSDSELAAAYARLGHVVTDTTRCDRANFEFCSHIYLNARAYPSTMWKSFYKLAESTFTLEQQNQFLDRIGESPDRLRLESALAELVELRNLQLVNFDAAKEDEPETPEGELCVE